MSTWLLTLQPKAMRIERLRPTVFRIVLHTYELSALVAAARWVAGGAEGELTEEARNQLRKVLDDYDREIRQLNSQ